MANGAPILERSDVVDTSGFEKTLSSLLDSLKGGRVNLMLRHQVCLTGLAAQEVGGDGVAEADGCAGSFGAEDDHVGEVDGGVVFHSGVFTEDAA